MCGLGRDLLEFVLRSFIWVIITFKLSASPTQVHPWQECKHNQGLPYSQCEQKSFLARHFNSFQNVIALETKYSVCKLGLTKYLTGIALWLRHHQPRQSKAPFNCGQLRSSFCHDGFDVCHSPGYLGHVFASIFRDKNIILYADLYAGNV